MKNKKVLESHVSKSKKSMGDFYGSGIKNKIGISRDITLEPKMSSKKIGKSPKSLA